MSNSDFESESAIDESVVSRKSGRTNAGMAGLLLALALGGSALAYFVFHDGSAKVEADEQFNTAQRPGDFNFRAKPAKTDNKLVMTPPVAPPPPQAAPAPPVVAAVVPTQPVDDGEAKRREAEKLARLKSPMIIYDGQGAATVSAAAGGGAADGSTSDPYKEDDPNRRFASAMGAQAVETVQATQNPRIDALIPQGTILRGVLETAIQSDLPGMVRAKTSEDVYSFDGRRILLPRDTMLTGTYRSGIARGQTRILIIWTRALRADGSSIALGSYGTDDLGRSGLAGDVDNHYLERFGSAAVLSLVGGVSSFIAGLNIHGQSTTGSTATTPAQQAQSQAQQSISQTMSDMANTALKDSISIPPTIHVDQGTQIVVFVQRDLDFSGLYASPLKEALQALRHGRSPRQ